MVDKTDINTSPTSAMASQLFKSLINALAAVSLRPELLDSCLSRVWDDCRVGLNESWAPLMLREGLAANPDALTPTSLP